MTLGLRPRAVSPVCFPTFDSSFDIAVRSRALADTRGHRKIFISGTTKGLAQYRQDATKVIAAQGYIPVVQEHFATPHDEIAREVVEKIREADAVLAIVGPYYGFASPVIGNDRARWSYSQLEVNFAIKTERRCIVAIATDLDALEACEPEPVELTQQQQRFIASLKTPRYPGFSWYGFSNRYDFAMVLAKLRWAEWLDGR